MFMMVMLGLLNDSDHLSTLSVDYLLPSICLYLLPVRRIRIIRLALRTDLLGSRPMTKPRMSVWFIRLRGELTR